MPLFADATVSGSEVGLIVLTVVNAIGAAFTFWIKAKYDQRFTNLEHELNGCVQKHAQAERESSEALSRVAGLEKQNSGQQTMIDTLTSRIIALVGSLRESGLPCVGDHCPAPSPPKG